jgi:hypothetical protein
MTNERFDALFGGPPRKPETADTPARDGPRRSIQVVTEEIMLAWPATPTSDRLKEPLPGRRRGAELRRQRRILREGPFDDLWIQPAAGDAGGALGAALFGLAPAARQRRGAAPRRRPPCSGLVSRARVLGRPRSRRSSTADGRPDRELEGDEDLLATTSPS